MVPIKDYPMMNAPHSLPRPEYPRPQFQRPDWLCLNGEWQFEIDDEDSGLERGLRDRALAGSIVVPFCPESTLSGIGETGFMAAVWYRRTVSVPPEWAGRRVLLHFQAVDHDTTVWVEGREVVRHRGGFTPFTADLGPTVDLGPEITVVVRARDAKEGVQARGKQSTEFANRQAYLTRTTGIWQTVWLEPVPETWFERPRITPDLGGDAIVVDAPVRGIRRHFAVRARLRDERGVVAEAEVLAGSDFTPRLSLSIPPTRRRTWSPEDPHLYGLELELVAPGGEVVDAATSYTGLRSVAIDGSLIRLNGRAVFQRLVVDQGYYPDGVMTAPTDEALIHDIEIAQAAGFNGARLHQKLFEERFLYHCDRLGYLVWGEFADWGTHPAPGAELATASLVTQWVEAVQRDYSHPSIIGWCPLNEIDGGQPGDRIDAVDDLIRAIYLTTKAIDPTRPVIDVSGFAHRIRETDVYDSHNYEQDATKLARQTFERPEGTAFTNGEEGDIALVITGLPPREWSIAYAGQPYFNSEFGGILWAPDLKKAEILAGYTPRGMPGEPEYDFWTTRLIDSPEEFYNRLGGLMNVMLDSSMFGYAYFQLYDTAQERLGIYAFDRTPKFDVNRIREMQTRPAAIEAED